MNDEEGPGKRDEKEGQGKEMRRGTLMIEILRDQEG